MTPLEDGAVGCLLGAAVGDAIGGATEGWDPSAIQERYGGLVTGIVPPFNPDWKTARPIAPYHKGDGHVTDDTLMTHALVRVYEVKRDHLVAHDIERYLVPELIERKTWIPELEAEALLIQRVFLAEKWIALRLHYGHVDPREAGVGNMVNCGAAMYMAPVGIANATNPARAYDEAIDIAGAHQSSYGREAAGVFAAAIAAAFGPESTTEAVVRACLDVAKDGTRSAIEAVQDAVVNMAHWSESFEAMRDAIRPFDTVADDYRNQGLGARRPSRLHSIEELPVALGFLSLTKGNYEDMVLAATNYGRDADSIAVMGGAIAGVLGGVEAVPTEWREQVAERSRIDLESPGAVMAEIAGEMHAKDRRRSASHVAAFESLIDS